MQFGVCGSPVDGPWMKAAGADFIEAHVQAFLKPMDTAWTPEVAPEALALPVDAYNCFLPGNLPVVGPAVNLDAVRSYVERACARARQMGSSVIVFGSGGARKVPDGWPREKGEEQLVESMRVIGPVAKAAGITVVMEPLNRGETNLLNSTAEGLGYIRRAAAPGIAILADFYHFTLEKEPLDDLDRAGPLLAHVHMAEPVGRIAPGPAMTDYRPFFHRLKAIGYDARISLECGWKDIRTQLGPTLEFLRKDWKAA